MDKKRQLVIDTRNFQENERRGDNQRRHLANLRHHLEQETLSTDALRDAVIFGQDRFTYRFFVHATLYLSFKQPVREINDLYLLLNNQVQDYGHIPEWKPLVLYILSKLMCDLHQIHGHNEMREFRSSLRQNIKINLRYKLAFPRFIYHYESTLPTDDDGHFQYASIFFDKLSGNKENECQRLEFEDISVLDRRISYIQHLEHFGLVDHAPLIGYLMPMPICAEFLVREKHSKEEN